ncbi:MAG: hypothetical protein U5L96_08000 [Owenweeksia sp.]|nr:hypothetical protein [Owenweeksia sp.]
MNRATSANPSTSESGDTAYVEEAVKVDSLDVANGAVMTMNPATCLSTVKATNSGDMIFEANATGFAQYKGPAR